MFCPKCGTENLLEQKFCRRCGHQLSAHRLALEGGVEDGLSNIKKSTKLLGSGIIILMLCIVNLLAIWIVGADKISIIFHSILGLVVALPLILLGLARVSSAERILNPKDSAGNKITSQPGNEALKPSDAVTDRSIAESVTEHTTLKLETPERAK